MLTDGQKAALEAPLERGLVKQRRQGGRMVDYIEGWAAIAAANRIFGHLRWGTQVIECAPITEEIVTNQNGTKGWNIGYRAQVRVELMDESGSGSGYTDVGFGNGISYQSQYDAHEGAGKEAVTDAEKRALRHLGWQFGLALYDKEQEHVSDDPAPVKSPHPPVNLPFTPRAAAAVHKHGTDDMPEDPDGSPTYADWEHTLRLGANADVAIKTKKYADRYPEGVPLATLYVLDEGYVKHWLAEKATGFAHDKAVEFLASLPDWARQFTAKATAAPAPVSGLPTMLRLIELLHQLGKTDAEIATITQGEHSAAWIARQCENALDKLAEQSGEDDDQNIPF